ncbi:hypothetical protein DFH09DRAFT_1492102 [Mycena vulgaris]|nr:hypothetical protein DFH09DRAFT_1492102 [Mycena vulgaris]
MANWTLGGIQMGRPVITVLDGGRDESDGTENDLAWWIVGNVTNLGAVKFRRSIRNGERHDEETHSYFEILIMSSWWRIGFGTGPALAPEPSSLFVTTVSRGVFGLGRPRPRERVHGSRANGGNEMSTAPRVSRRIGGRDNQWAFESWGVQAGRPIVTRMACGGGHDDSPRARCIGMKDPIKRGMVYKPLGKFTKLYKALQMSQTMLSLSSGGFNSCHAETVQALEVLRLLSMPLSPSSGASARMLVMRRARQQYQDRSQIKPLPTSRKTPLSSAFPKFIKPKSQASPHSEVELQAVHPLPKNFKFLAARIRIEPPTYMLGTPPSSASPILWWLKTTRQLRQAHAHPDRVPLRFLPGTGTRVGLNLLAFRLAEPGFRAKNVTARAVPTTQIGTARVEGKGGCDVRRGMVKVKSKRDVADIGCGGLFGVHGIVRILENGEYLGVIVAMSDSIRRSSGTNFRFANGTKSSERLDKDSAKKQQQQREEGVEDASSALITRARIALFRVLPRSIKTRPSQLQLDRINLQYDSRLKEK